MAQSGGFTVHRHRNRFSERVARGHLSAHSANGTHKSINTSDAAAMNNVSVSTLVPLQQPPPPPPKKRGAPKKHCTFNFSPKPAESTSTAPSQQTVNTTESNNNEKNPTDINHNAKSTASKKKPPPPIMSSIHIRAALANMQSQPTFQPLLSAL